VAHEAAPRLVASQSVQDVEVARHASGGITSWLRLAGIADTVPPLHETGAVGSAAVAQSSGQEGADVEGCLRITGREAHFRSFRSA
jgi:hypothetical protein